MKQLDHTREHSGANTRKFALPRIVVFSLVLTCTNILSISQRGSAEELANKSREWLGNRIESEDMLRIYPDQSLARLPAISEPYLSGNFESDWISNKCFLSYAGYPKSMFRQSDFDSEALYEDALVDI
ncbi:MAG: hypothetical protein ACFFCW_48235 [Candidatus Hodarchaeota archaeon]